MESGRTRAQTISDDFFWYRWKFRLITIRWNRNNQDWFTGKNAVHHNILRIPKNTFPIIESRVQVELGHAIAQTISDDFF